MTKAVWKYVIPAAGPTGWFELEIPAGHRVLHVGAQGAWPCLWVLVDPKGKQWKRRFRVVYTGEEFDADRLVYHGSFAFDDAVGHLFEVRG